MIVGPVRLDAGCMDIMDDDQMRDLVVMRVADDYRPAPLSRVSPRRRVGRARDMNSVDYSRTYRGALIMREPTVSETVSRPITAARKNR